MKHLTMADKSLLTGDEAADILAEYAGVLARLSSGDTVMVRVLTVEGEEEVATFVLNGGVSLIAESTHSRLPEPDNSEAIAYIRDRLRQFNSSDDLIPGSNHPFADDAG